MVNRNFEINLKRFIGQECWAVVGGKGTGTVICLDFGLKIPRKNKLKNRHLTEDTRTYRSEFSLFIQCSWRLDAEFEVVCGSKESNEEGGERNEGLKKLIHKHVTAIDLIKPAFDLNVHFDEKLILRIFCDETNPDEDEKFDNYYLFIPECVFTVSNRSQLIVEECSQDAL